MYKIAIVEDEAEQSERLVTFLKNYAKKKDVEIQSVVFHNGIDFLTDYTAEFHAVFLDIQLPMMDGMSVAEKLREKDEDVIIVFVTNMAQLAIKGYKVSALDLLVKPVGEFEVSMELDKIMRRVKDTEDKYLYVNAQGGLTRILFSEIYYIEMLDHNITIHTKKGELSYRGTLKSLSEKLDGRMFSRPNNSYIVNMSYIRGIQGDSIFIEPNEQIFFSRARKKPFLNDFTLFINGRQTKWLTFLRT